MFSQYTTANNLLFKLGLSSLLFQEVDMNYFDKALTVCSDTWRRIAKLVVCFVQHDTDPLSSVILVTPLVEYDLSVRENFQLLVFKIR